MAAAKGRLPPSGGLLHTYDFRLIVSARLSFRNFLSSHSLSLCLPAAPLVAFWVWHSTVLTSSPLVGDEIAVISLMSD